MTEAKGTIDLATVVFAGEIALLRLQAVSVARFVPPDLVRRIYLIVNDADEAECARRIEAILPDYGPLAEKVEIVRPDALFRPRSSRAKGIGGRFRVWFTEHRYLYPFGRKGGWRSNRGWSLQQALKLAVARRAEAPFLLILDAKNHFVRTVSAESFISPAGRARSALGRPTDAQYGWIVASFRRLGSEPPPREAPAPPILTPFCIETQVLRACLDHIESVVGPVEAFFARKRSPEAEFMLIYASVVARHGGWDRVFDPGLVPPALVGRTGSTAGAFEAVETGAAEVLAVHRARIGRLTAEERARLGAIWRERGLPDLLGPSG